MKNKAVFFLIVCSVLFCSCRKEEDPKPYSPPVWPVFSAYTKTRVIDSVTMAQIPNAEAYMVLDSGGDEWRSKTIISGGWYITHVTWLEHPHITTPGDNTDLYIYAHWGSESGIKKIIKYGQLIQNETLTVADVYVH